MTCVARIRRDKADGTMQLSGIDRDDVTCPRLNKIADSKLVMRRTRKLRVRNDRNGFDA